MAVTNVFMAWEKQRDSLSSPEAIAATLHEQEKKILEHTHKWNELWELFKKKG